MLRIDTFLDDVAVSAVGDLLDAESLLYLVIFVSVNAVMSMSRMVWWLSNVCTKNFLADSRYCGVRI